MSRADIKMRAVKRGLTEQRGSLREKITFESYSSSIGDSFLVNHLVNHWKLEPVCVSPQHLSNWSAPFIEENLFYMNVSLPASHVIFASKRYSLVRTH